MRQPVPDRRALVINTCSGNKTAELGDTTHWTWANPTNLAVAHPYYDVEAVSVECLWQGTKILHPSGMTKDNLRCLAGDWRLGKGRRPLGAYAGPDQPWIKDPGQARRAIYLPAYNRLVQHWMRHGALELVQAARLHPATVYLRDHDTGQGIDRDGPMSHAWLLSVWLTTGAWPP